MKLGLNTFTVAEKLEGAGLRLHASLGHRLFPEHALGRRITFYPVMNLLDVTLSPKLS